MASSSLSTGLQMGLVTILLFGVFFLEGEATGGQRMGPSKTKGKSPKRTASAGGVSNPGGGGLTGTKCAGLFPNCATCTPGFKECASCQSGFKMVNRKCYADCGFGSLGNDFCTDQPDCSCPSDGPFMIGDIAFPDIPTRFCNLNIDGISSYCVMEDFCDNLSDCYSNADCDAKAGYVCQLSCCGVAPGKCALVRPCTA